MSLVGVIDCRGSQKRGVGWDGVAGLSLIAGMSSFWRAKSLDFLPDQIRPYAIISSSVRYGTARTHSLEASARLAYVYRENIIGSNPYLGMPRPRASISSNSTIRTSISDIIIIIFDAPVVFVLLRYFILFFVQLFIRTRYYIPVETMM
jgi:hypothetical protein